LNAVLQLPAGVRAGGIWTVSAGNAGQGIAYAARDTGVPASVLVMDTAPATKLDAIARLGASVVQAPYEECWRAVETRRSDRMTGHFVHPFDDDDFITGNGTVALEILEDLPDVDAVVVPVGGGGLVAGVGTVMRAERPGVRVYSAEPETAAPLAASRAAGQPLTFDRWMYSFVDGAGGRSVLPSMWPLLQDVVDESLVVSLEEVAAAMRLVADRSHVIAEGAAGCGIAAALSGVIRRAGHRRVVAILSGGNIDLSRFASVIGACS
jgi:threonine dehydratase